MKCVILVKISFDKIIQQATTIFVNREVRPLIMAPQTSEFIENRSRDKYRDPAWAHFTHVEGSRYSNVCRYCGGEFRGGNITRLKQHLAGIVGNIRSCSKMPEHVRYEMLQLFQRKNANKITNKAKRKSYCVRTQNKVKLSSEAVESEEIAEESTPCQEEKVVSRLQMSKTNQRTRIVESLYEGDLSAHPDSDTDSEFEEIFDEVEPAQERGPAQGLLSAKDDYIPQSRPTKQFRNKSLRRSKDKELDTDLFESFMEYIWGRISEGKRTYCTYFDSLWFSMYKNDTSTNVLQWIKKKEVFSKKYVFIPIVCWSHWSLLILCNFGGTDHHKPKEPCMLLLDSLSDTNPNRLENDIRKFILDIYEIEERKEDRRFISTIPLLIPNVPQQSKGDECGTYVLYYIYRFLACPPHTFTIQGYPYFLTPEWFTDMDITVFTKEIEAFSMKKKSEADLLETSEQASHKGYSNNKKTDVIEID